MEHQLIREIEMLYGQVCHALGDPIRLALIYALSRQPRYVGELADELKLPQSTVSRHLKILRDRALVETKRDGTTIYYSLTDDRLVQALDLLRGILRDRITQQAQLAEFIALDAHFEESDGACTPSPESLQQAIK